MICACTARAALAGNPSDGYGGAVVAVPIPDLTAYASIDPADTFSVSSADADLRRLLQCSADEYAERFGPVAAGRLSATTTIPRSVGLAGSSAIVIAAFRAMAVVTGHDLDPIEVADAALAVERERMGIAAGLQDRLVQAAGAPVAMEFDPVGFRPLRGADGLPLFVAWSEAASETSDTVHRSLRRRFDAGDPHVVTSMAGLTEQARAAADAIEAGRLPDLAAAINRTFELRALMIDIDPLTLELAEIGRRAGAAMNSAGSGGSVVGLVPSATHVERVVDAIEAAGHRAISLV